MTPDESGVLAVALARVEGKIDAYAARTSAVEEKVEALDTRLREQESRSVVTPSGLLAALVATVTCLGGSVAFLDRLYS
jgi:hypothetical protein